MKKTLFLTALAVLSALILVACGPKSAASNGNAFPSYGNGMVSYGDGMVSGGNVAPIVTAGNAG